MLSPKSARKADENGYTNVKVYHDGLPVWKKKKNTLYSTVKGLATFNEKAIPYVLIDARKDTSAGFIPGAVALPPDRLEGMKAGFPKQKKAPVIIYGSGKEAAAAFTTVRGWGYKNASILDGGVDAWVSAGNSLDGKAREKVTYVPKPRPGEMPVAEFRKAADTPSSSVVILDVRGSDETSQGMIRGALNVPLTELEERTANIPRDKKVVAQCNTGAQAEMAYNLLREAGFDVAWLNAKITITADGSYTIEDN